MSVRIMRLFQLLLLLRENTNEGLNSQGFSRRGPSNMVSSGPTSAGISPAKLMILLDTVSDIRACSRV